MQMCVSVALCSSGEITHVGGPTVEVQTAEEAKSLSRTGVV